MSIHSIQIDGGTFAAVVIALAVIFRGPLANLQTKVKTKIQKKIDGGK